MTDNAVRELYMESDMDSVWESVSSSTTSFGDISICEEIGELIGKCHELYSHIHNSFDTLNKIKTLVFNQNNIIVSYEGWTGDLDELLEKLHEEALKNINEGRASDFGTKLLKVINESTFS